MRRVKCFMLEPTEKIDRKLRRYSRDNTPDCCPTNPGQYSYHNASVPLDVATKDEDTQWPHDDPRWPKMCKCGYEFKDSDNWQLFTETVWRRTDTGEETTLRNAPGGAMYFADWYEGMKWACGPDGKSLCVVLPNGRTWMIDSRANNCTLPNDNEHKCWVRHGTPPEITVDKAGLTCGAGAGSILSGDYHGFLRNGFLED